MSHGEVPSTCTEKHADEGVNDSVRWPRIGRVGWDILVTKVL